MKKTYKRGFTLIELLVVIAIIGILASIILASLATARSKGNDARIEEQLGNMRSQAQLYTGGVAPVGTAGGATPLAVCPTSGTTNLFYDTTASDNSLTSLFTNVTGAYCYTAATLPSAGGAWVVVAPLSTGSAWCVDSTGQSKPETTAVTSGATAFSDTNGAGACL